MGDGIARFFDDKVIVDNHAVNGRSSLSFINEGRWKKVLDSIKPGDYVFIQFGHNDEKSMPDRHTDPGSTFDANLARYVNETRAKGGIPVLFNAVVRRCYYSAELKMMMTRSFAIKYMMERSRLIAIRLSTPTELM